MPAVKKPKNLDRSLSEAHILNGFQYGGKVGKVNLSSIKAVSFLVFFSLAETREHLQNNSNGLSQQCVPQ